MISILKKDIRLIINIKRIIISFIFFVLVYILFSALFSNFMTEKRLLDKVTIGIVDEEQSLLSGMLIDNFGSNEKFSSLFEFQQGSEELLLESYNNNELSAIVYIPKSFTDSLLYYKNTPLKMILNPNFPLKNTVLENIMSSYSTYIKSVDIATYSLYNSLKTENLEKSNLNNVNDLFSLNMVMTALNRNTIFEYKSIDTFPSSSSQDYFIFSVIILLIIFATTSGSSLISKEITDHCITRYLATGKSTLKFVSSKIIVMTLNIFLSLLPFIFILRIVNSSITMGILALLILFITTVILFFTSISFLLGIIFYKHELNMLLSTLLTLLLGIVGGNFIPIQLMPKFMQDLSGFTPNYWILRSLLYVNSGLTSNEPQIVMFILFCMVLMASVLQAFLLKRSVL